MLDYSNLHREPTDNRFYTRGYEFNEDGKDTDEYEVEVSPMFPMEYWKSPADYAQVGIRGYEPMTAKELDTEEVQDEKLNSKDYIIEEKFDGTRALVYFIKQDCLESGEVVDSEGWCRVFSRRISKKTGFYVENTDSLPHIRDINIPSLAGTVIDCELFIDGKPFKDVSSTLNCKWDKALDRQIEKGFVNAHAFDILFYRGIDLRNMKLEKRKKYLEIVVKEVEEYFKPLEFILPYKIKRPIQLVDWQECGSPIDVKPYVNSHGSLENIYIRLKGNGKLDSFPHFKKEMEEVLELRLEIFETYTDLLTPRAFYEYIVASGGEGVMVKPKDGKYKHKRGWEYSKIKAFLTRELILLDFEEPTREYTGKLPDNWGYWEGSTPVTRHYYNKQVGNMVLGVLITKEEYDSIVFNKRGKLYSTSDFGLPNVDDYFVMTVCVTSGFNDGERAYFTRNEKKLIGSVVEVKANDIMKDSGKLRHPRFLRLRPDKNIEQCTWKDHIGG